MRVSPYTDCASALAVQVLDDDWLAYLDGSDMTEAEKFKAALNYQSQRRYSWNPKVALGD